MVGDGLVPAIQRTLLVIGASMAAFVAGTPYAVLDLPFFLNDYADLASTFAGVRTGEPGWSIYLKQLSAAFGWPAFIALMSGLGLALWRVVAGPDRARTTVLLVFSMVYFFVMAGSFQVYGRYLLPLLPIGSLFAAVAVTTLAGRLGNRLPSRRGAALAATALVAVVLVEPAWRGVTFSHQLGRPTTVDAAYAWILEHVPAGATVAVEAGALTLPPRYRMLIVTQFTQRPREWYETEGVEYFLAAGPEFQHALANPREASGAYRAFFADAVELAAFDASVDRTGPNMRLFRVVR
jgi:hypothetical protein